VIEIMAPLALTLGMLAIYNTIKPQVLLEMLPNATRTIRFDHFYAINGNPQCTGYDSNIFWRCPTRDCSPDACNKLVFAVAPSSNTDTAAAEAASALELRVQDLTNSSVSTLLFPSEADLDAYIAQPDYAVNTTLKNIGVAVVFDSGAPNWHYHLRVNRTVNEGYTYNLPPTTLSTDSLLKNPNDWPKVCSRCSGQYLQSWYQSGALAVQNLVDSFIISQAAGAPRKLAASVVNFPSPGYTEAGFWGQAQSFFPIFMLVTILYSVSNVVRSLVTEKEARIREGMRMMALTDSALYASWVFHFATTFTIIAALIVLVGGKLFQHSDKGLVFAFFLLFFFATMAFAFWMSTFFSKSKTAASLGIMPYFAGYFLTMALKPASGRSVKLLASLHPAAAFALGISAFTEYEDAQQGVTLFTFATSANGNFAFSDALGMLLVDVFVYAFLFWYFEKVWPNEFGTRLPPYFLCMPSYWNSWLGIGRGEVRPLHEGISNSSGELKQESGPDVERVPDTLAQQIKEGKCICIRDMCKTFSTNTGPKHAVDHLNLTMYSGQITALLGHNGAGKSTTIGILTGLTAPTSGVAIINGMDVSQDMQSIRHSLGVCPQHDVLFADLTVEEHLTLFANFKGMPRSEVQAAVTSMIAEVGLTEKRKVASKNLSGGMKRKLSLGIAFIGGSKVVILDEPTSGIDAYSRRFVWNVIRKYKEGRTIILTTHFLEEADLLGDRIAIMAKGKLRACGSSLFLKNNFGVGYNLTIEKKAAADATRIQRYVQNKVQDAKVLSCVGAEISFQLPRNSAEDFKALFEGLDNHQEALGLEHYGVSVTTLEEVFIRVTRGDEIDVEAKAAISVRRNSLEERRRSLEESRRLRTSLSYTFDERGSHDESHKGLGAACQKDLSSGDVKAPPGAGTYNKQVNNDAVTDVEKLHIDYNNYWLFFRRHMYALLVKRMLYLKRDKKAWVYQFVLPALFVLVGCLLMRAGVNSIFAEKMPPLTLSLDAYNPGIQTNRNPLPYNAEGESFIFTMWEGNQQMENPNVVGQDVIMAAIPSGSTLPTYSIAANSVQNMSSGLLDTRRDWKASRYGALTFAVVDDLEEFNYNVHANYTGAHSSAIFANLINDALLQQYAPGSSIKTTIKPLGVTRNEISTAASFDGFTIVIMMMLAFAFIPAAFALFVVRERETKAKHLQLVSGVSFLSYWLSTWLFDFASYQVPLWMTIVILKLFDAQALMNGKAFGATVLLMELFGTSVTGFTYLISFLFAKHSKAQVATIMLNFMCGLILAMITMIMTFIPTTRDVALKLVYLFRLAPPFAAGNGLLNVVFTDFFSSLDQKQYTPYSLNIAGYSMIYMSVETVVYFVLVLCVEYLIRRPTVSKLLEGGSSSMAAKDCSGKDEAVLEEEDRVRREATMDTMKAGGDVVVIKDMTKTYRGGKLAVRGMSLGIPNGECFGLLGVNGAGKTTTLSILTAEFPPSSGQVWLGGYDIADNPEVVRRLVGYCPQFDALFDLLTGQEHLELYARVKGLSEAQVKTVVARKVMEMDLVEFANRNATTYSGGNRRKLSVAMAMIGSPQIVILDEPSSGMDAVARRFMWKVISDITTKRGECCVILTTHSMEECEALCTRIGIMVGGRFRCMGSAQHLKSRYGMGYQLEISVALPRGEIVPASDDEDSGGETEGKRMVLPADDTFLARLEGAAARLSTERFTMPQLEIALAAIDKAAWLEVISPTGTGADVWQTVTASGSIGVREFAGWCSLEDRVESILRFIMDNYPDAVLRERQGTKVRFEIPSTDTNTGAARKLSEMFGLIEDNKGRLHVEDYSVCQTSLEQIFNFFAGQQEEEKGPAGEREKEMLQMGCDVCDVVTEEDRESVENVSALAETCGRSTIISSGAVI
jgi:ABC-type multidrug transport system ATPase subunit